MAGHVLMCVLALCAALRVSSSSCLASGSCTDEGDTSSMLQSRASIVQRIDATLVEAESAAAVAANAANKAAVAAEVAAVAATTAANAAVTANAAVDAAAKANTEASTIATESVPAGAQPVTTTTSVSSSWSVSQWLFHACTGVSLMMVIKALCVVGNVLMQVSPLPQVRCWASRGCTGEADAAPYVAIAFVGFQWCFYGVFAWLETSRRGFLILVQANCLGAILGMYYLYTFRNNCNNKLTLTSLQKYISAVSALAVLQICAICVLSTSRALLLVGIIASFCSFIGATSILVTVPAVIRTRDSHSLPGLFTVANFASSLMWCLCGYLLADPLVTIPNMVSCFCSGTCLGLMVLYPSELWDYLDSASDDNLDKFKQSIVKETKETISQSLRKAFSEAAEFAPKPKDVTFPDCVADASTEEDPPVPVDAGGGDGTGGTC